MSDIEKLLENWDYDWHDGHVSFFAENDGRNDYNFRVEFGDGIPEAAEFEIAHRIAAAPDLLAALAKAEDFIAGFEDDPAQEGVKALLEEIRNARRRATEVVEGAGEEGGAA